LKSSRAGDTRFDASQYAFFGNNVLEEVELGGLEDDNELEVQPFIYSMLDKCCIEYNSRHLYSFG
jgi:hypothetical protein